MRIIGLLSWYDENPRWLTECVKAAALICDFVIAVDGPYAHFPGAADTPRSPREQIDALVAGADATSIGLHYFVRDDPWKSEISKRNTMFELGRQYAVEGDWFFRVDADELVSRVPPAFRETLEESEHDVAEALLWDQTWGGSTPLRCFYRNVKDLHIEQTHYLVKAGGRVLNGPNQVEAEDVWDLRIDHRTHERTRERMALKAEYNELIPTLEKLCP